MHSLGKMIDEKLIVEKCQNGERMAQRQLFDAFSPRLYAIVSRYLADDEAAKDVMQEAFISVFEKIGSFRWKGPGSLRSWCEQIAVNKSLNYLRDNRVQLQMTDSIDDVQIGDERYDPDDEDLAAISHEQLLTMIERLPVGYRTVFNLFCVEGYSHRQIARMLGINERSSSSQLSRAKSLLAKQIKDFLKSKNDGTIR